MPHVASADWLSEPDGAFGITPESGQTIYSTMIPAAAQASVMNEFGEDENLLAAEIP
ncbi:hypothetical protein ACQPYA_07225 [Micromonospora sp. CA-263727]|uniref:hypothetical protein n=1 Tax=Micromonospora sp. CA-263727 TaxID=3239967 RepID=UPI003D8DF45F